MKRIILVLALCASLSSCRALTNWAVAPADPAVPDGPTQGEAVIQDVGGVLSAIPGAGQYVLLASAIAAIYFGAKKAKQKS